MPFLELELTMGRKSTQEGETWERVAGKESLEQACGVL
jgi:hypothetical protein